MLPGEVHMLALQVTILYKRIKKVLQHLPIYRIKRVTEKV